MKNVFKSIGEELRKLRKTKNLTLKEVAEKAGVSTMYISEIERDLKVPSDEVICKLAKIYNVDEKELFEGFGRIPEDILEELTSNKDLFAVLYEVSRNNKLDEASKERLYKQIYELYKKLLKDIEDEKG
jgi:transcriptional regulator with XRE-family HTH domain